MSLENRHGFICLCFFFFQAEDGIRDLVRSRGLGDVYKRQGLKTVLTCSCYPLRLLLTAMPAAVAIRVETIMGCSCLLYTSDAADERSSVDLGGRRIIKKTKYVIARDRVSAAKQTQVGAR